MDRIAELALKLPPAVEKSILDFMQVMTYGAWAWAACGAAIAFYFVMKARSLA